jgi:hypothetical protein
MYFFISLSQAFFVTSEFIELIKLEHTPTSMVALKTDMTVKLPEQDI